MWVRILQRLPPQHSLMCAHSFFLYCFGSACILCERTCGCSSGFNKGSHMLLDQFGRPLKPLHIPQPRPVLGQSETSTCKSKKGDFMNNIFTRVTFMYALAQLALIALAVGILILAGKYNPIWILGVFAPLSLMIPLGRARQISIMQRKGGWVVQHFQNI